MVVPLLVVCKEQQSACDNVRPVVQKTHEFGIVHIICKVGLAWWNCITGMPCRNTLQQKRGHFEKMLAIGRMNVILCEAAQIWTKSWCPRLSEASIVSSEKSMLQHHPDCAASWVRRALRVLHNWVADKPRPTGNLHATEFALHAEFSHTKRQKLTVFWYHSDCCHPCS